MKKQSKNVSKLFDDSQLQIDKKFKNNLLKQLTESEEMKKVNSTKFGKVLLKSRFASLAVAVGILGLVAGTSATISGNRAEKTALQGVAIPTDLNDVLSINDIRTKAAALAPTGVSITQVELEQEHGGLFYKVKFSDGTFRLFNARTGEAVNSTSGGIETNGTVPADFNPSITLQQAREIAQNQRPDKTITKIELESEEGAVVYSVRFSDGGRVDVNATNGSVSRVEGSSSSSSSQSSSSSSQSPSSDDSSNHDLDDDNSGSSGSSNSGSGSDDSNDDDSSGSSSGSGSSDDSDDNSSGDNGSDDD